MFYEIYNDIKFKLFKNKMTLSVQKITFFYVINFLLSKIKSKLIKLVIKFCLINIIILKC